MNTSLFCMDCDVCSSFKSSNTHHYVTCRERVKTEISTICRARVQRPVRPSLSEFSMPDAIFFTMVAHSYHINTSCIQTSQVVDDDVFIVTSHLKTTWRRSQLLKYFLFSDIMGLVLLAKFFNCIVTGNTLWCD